jgi:5-methylcytosine-specific restriction endonuclease McrA
VRKISATSYRKWKAFYHTTAWKHKRKEILKRDHGSCRRCRQQGRYTQAVAVHHIKHLKDVPELALTNDNLISLCNECHEAMHPEKHKRKNGFQNQEKW